MRGRILFEGLVDYYVGCLLDRVLDHHWQCLSIFLLFLNLTIGFDSHIAPQSIVLRRVDLNQHRSLLNRIRVILHILFLIRIQRQLKIEEMFILRVIDLRILSRGERIILLLTQHLSPSQIMQTCSYMDHLYLFLGLI